MSETNTEGVSSPFPGMDPYLEAPGVWPDFHKVVAVEISAVLNGHLPDPYYAQLDVREESGISDEIGLAEPRTEISGFEEIWLDRPTVNFVEIRDRRADHEVVTLIEILSPSNKRPGPDQQRYLEKREAVLGSRTSLIEIDLLRGGERSYLDPDVHWRLNRKKTPVDYLVTVNRAWKRIAYQVFWLDVTQPLPVIAVPLREEHAETPLDLQYAFQQTYQRGPYRRRVDYSQPPQPPLPESLSDWAKRCVESRRAT